ncbi:3-hydroxyanthranilate 3,4-dioxygenase [Malassezia japonica]|uniref:3-hydroxyanthranilate 3,4-dioxygenase n=1 Tax=Malassezia japonica TaxID=223818 RepID=A0AAF0JHW2_9BASI|nr:3-hydroxyanthranilate 3,4-dioxygenase [Malassezia japonica]WFD41176.1 3-hydroxyanthranilate 3,4-dioxygenase [Malassezia japonica]
MITPPFNFQQWVDDHRHLLKPPVGNKCLLRTDGYFVMVVGGPNERTDFHYQPTEELFYQVQGTMYLRVVDDGQFKEIEIKEGEMFLLPANTLHSPKRLADTVGVVLERAREEPGKPVEIHSARFLSKDLFTELPRLLKVWAEDASLRVCKECGHQASALESPHCPRM